MERILSVDDLRITFETYAGTIHAVNGMSFDICQGEIFGLVGESGCGKSVTGRAIMRVLTDTGEISGGGITYQRQDLLSKSEGEMKSIRGKQMAMVFQDPSASLNPVFTIGNQINHILRHHTGMDKKAARQRALELFDSVALPDAEDIYQAYPHQLSGGMQQRVMIAMALSSGAELLIADEPTTALDVTIQAQILDLLVDLRDREGIAVLLITHNLGVVSKTCDRVAVAYAGRIVETGPTRKILHNMVHPYTCGLLSALPTRQSKGQLLQPIAGQVPNGLRFPQGCAFAPRCAIARDLCLQSRPEMQKVDDQGHGVACHYYQEVAE
jgi:peptide/nickel transport system ATP-binding protein/oligopeptide transport system ATP-binding protein